MPISEVKILAACIQKRDTWTKIKNHVDPKNLSPHGERLWAKINEYYENDHDVGCADADILAARLERETKNPKHIEALKAYIGALPAADGISGINVSKELIAIKRNAVGALLASAILSNEIPKPEVLEEYNNLVESEGLEDDEAPYKIHKNIGVHDLIPHVDNSVRIPLFPNALNERIGGGCVPGDSVLIFARPECGKTAAALNFMRGGCKAGKRAIYFGNEDAMVRILLRAKASFSELGTEECLNDPEQADKRAAENGFGNATFVEMYPGSVQQIREIVQSERPDAIIIDQLPNLEGGKTENYTLHLGTLAKGIREIAKKYECVAISFCQAGESAEGKLVLEMGDINWSNTDVQAQADLMIGIGMNKDYEAKDWRMWSICKNKLTGVHDWFPTRIDRAKSRIYSL